MLELSYPSGDFAAAWREATGRGQEFRVNVRVGPIRRRAMESWIDFLCHDGPYEFVGLGAPLCWQLYRCAAKTLATGRYSIDRSETRSGIRFTFRRDDSGPGLNGGSGERPPPRR